MQLWTTSDIAKALNVGASLTSNWGNPGRRQVPDPFAVTRSGVRLWDAEQAEQIIAGYQEWREDRRLIQSRAEDQQGDKERAERALLALVHGKPKSTN